MLLLYAYCAGVVSSRKIECACYEDLAFRVLTGNQQPDHSRISESRVSAVACRTRPLIQAPKRTVELVTGMYQPC